MAKFTAYYNGKPTQSHIFESGIVRIGRDDTNDFIIDNLAIAPAHAVVIIKDNSCVIKQLNDEFPIAVNDVTSKEALLQNNDTISIGKHSLIYSTTETVIPIHNNNEANKDIVSLNGKLQETVKMPNANLQVMDGQHIGRILPLKKSITRLGQTGSGTAVITKRKDGYFISTLEGTVNILVNLEQFSETPLALNNNDIVIIDNISMQFFLEN